MKQEMKCSTSSAESYEVLQEELVLIQNELTTASEYIKLLLEARKAVLNKKLEMIIFHQQDGINNYYKDIYKDEKNMEL
ncbi:hypothetical protein [Paenibacillus elgii]|uniref:hypothetical protein n=1 Tax=Paenibacillus elgii TaxID=189691 RepID=UPI00203BF74D|nr:hypothetical protein [Paenibacillus elgii]MCM3270882.1 hypothetical protein [Paenibacillus elgii]